MTTRQTPPQGQQGGPRKEGQPIGVEPIQDEVTRTTIRLRGELLALDGQPPIGANIRIREQAFGLVTKALGGDDRAAKAVDLIVGDWHTRNYEREKASFGLATPVDAVIKGVAGHLQQGDGLRQVLGHTLEALQHSDHTGRRGMHLPGLVGKTLRNQLSRSGGESQLSGAVKQLGVTLIEQSEQTQEALGNYAAIAMLKGNYHPEVIDQALRIRAELLVGKGELHETVDSQSLTYLSGLVQLGAGLLEGFLRAQLAARAADAQTPRRLGGQTQQRLLPPGNPLK